MQRRSLSVPGVLIPHRESDVADLVFVVLTMTLFGLLAVLVRGAERL